MTTEKSRRSSRNASAAPFEEDLLRQISMRGAPEERNEPQSCNTQRDQMGEAKISRGQRARYLSRIGGGDLCSPCATKFWKAMLSRCIKKAPAAPMGRAGARCSSLPGQELAVYVMTRRLPLRK